MIKGFFKLKSTNSANLNDGYNQKNNFSIIYLLLIFILISCTNTSNKILTSPDNKIELGFEIIDGEAFYSINKDDKSVIKKSKLGILLENKLNIGKNLEIIKQNEMSPNISSNMQTTYVLTAKGKKDMADQKQALMVAHEKATTGSHGMMSGGGGGC